jgi:protein-S-isoprenylcysteine O-methyltransferase Ste14
MGKTVVRLVGAALVAALALAGTSLGQSARIAVSMIIGLPAFVLMIISRRQLGAAFSIMPQAKALVTTGLYSRIQHPMYVFLDLFLAALIVAFGIPLALLVWGIIVITQTLQSRREERVLAARFAGDYEAYRSRTWF